MPETNYSINFPNNGIEMMLPQPPLPSIISHLFKNPKHPLDDEIEHENSITVFIEESCTKTHSKGTAEQFLIW